MTSNSGWIVPWEIEKDKSGQYYLDINSPYFWLDPEKGGTLTAFVEIIDKDITISIHPDGIDKIKREKRENSILIKLQLDNTMPNEADMRANQRLDTIAFVDKYSPDLANWMILNPRKE